MSLAVKTVASKRCPLCCVVAVSVTLLLSHLRCAHSCDPNFNVICGLGGCITTSRSFSALYFHIYRKHPYIIRKRSGVPTADSQLGGISESESNDAEPLQEQFTTYVTHDVDRSDGLLDSADIRYLMNTDEKEIRRSSALLILKLKEQCHVSQNAINIIVGECKGLLSQTLTRVQAGLKARLASLGLDPEVITGLDDVFSEIIDPFQGLHTYYLQQKYYHEELGLVEPQEIKIGPPQHCPQFSGVKRRTVEKYDTYQYISVLDTLKILLSDKAILHEIFGVSKRISSTYEINDFCDGDRYKNHPLFTKDNNALQIISHFDEVEVVNPLGSHIKHHKLGIVVFTLGNISPQLRSQLKFINLAIVATVPIIEKYGLDKVLEPYIKDLNILSTTGITVTISGKQHTFKGALLTFLADNLASNDLGGFKKSFSFAFRSCRTCMVTKDLLGSSFVSNKFELRTCTKHKKQLEKITGPAASLYSSAYGINRRSSLLDVKFFDIFEGGLPHDAMHDVLEGVAPLEIKLLLSHCFTNHFITLQALNDRLLNFNFGYTITNKPIPILSSIFQSQEKSIRGSAAQISVLIQVLPFLIGDKIPEDNSNWLCFLLLRRITEIIFSPVLRETHCSSLKLLIEEHHNKFVALYGYDYLIPKMHFLVHYPEQIRLLGPMVHTWTMRYEAKLNFFKQSSRLSNFKNITYSVATSHQRWICYQRALGSLVGRAHEYGPLKPGTTPLSLDKETNDIQQQILKILPEIDMKAMVIRPTWIHTDGILYKNNNAYLVIGFDGLDPLFGRLDELLVIDNSTVFMVTKCKVQYFDSHYYAYVIKIGIERSFLCNISHKNVYHAHKLDDGLLYITLKHLVF